MQLSNQATANNTIDINKYQEWITFYAKRTGIKVIFDNQMQAPAAIDLRDVKHPTILLNPYMIKEEFKYTEEEILVDLFHELEHLKEESKMRATGSGQKIREENDRRLKDRKHLGKAFFDMQNCFRDFFVDGQIVSPENMPVLFFTLVELYRKKLFKENNFLEMPVKDKDGNIVKTVKHPKHLQFLHTILREERVKDEKCILDKKVYRIIQRLRRNGSIEKATTGKLEDRLQGMWQIEPIFLKLLEEDIEEDKNNEPEQGDPSNGEPSQGDSSDGEPSDGDPSKGEPSDKKNKGDDSDDDNGDDEWGDESDENSDGDSDGDGEKSDDDSGKKEGKKKKKSKKSKKEDDSGDDEGEKKKSGDSSDGEEDDNKDSGNESDEDNEDNDSGNDSDENSDGDSDGEGDESSENSDGDSDSDSDSDSESNEGGKNKGGKEQDTSPPKNPFDDYYNKNKLGKILEDNIDPEDLEKIGDTINNHIEEKNRPKTKEELELENRAKMMGVDPEDEDAMEEMTNNLQEYDRFLEQLEQVEDPESKEAVMDEIENLFAKIRSHRLKPRYKAKGPVDIEKGVRLHGPSLAAGIADIKSGNINPEMFEEDVKSLKELPLVGKFDLTIVGDGSGSMSGQKNTQQKIAILLVFEALKRLYDALEEDSYKLKQGIEFNTEGLMFNGTDVDTFKNKSPDFSDKERIDAYKILDYDDGNYTNDYDAMEEILNSLRQEDDQYLQDLLSGKAKKIVLVMTDGGSSNTNTLKGYINELRELGVLVYGIGITSGGSAVISNYRGDDELMGKGEICESPENLASVIKNILMPHLSIL